MERLVLLVPEETYFLKIGTFCKDATCLPNENMDHWLAHTEDLPLRVGERKKLFDPLGADLTISIIDIRMIEVDGVPHKIVIVDYKASVLMQSLLLF